MNPRPLVLHVFPSLEAGGTQMRTGQLVSADSSSEHHIVALDGGATRDRAGTWLPKSVPVTTLAKRGSLHTIRTLRRLFLRTRPDLILTHSWGGIDGILANALSVRAPLAHYEDAFSSDESESRKLRRIWARRLILRLADRVVVPSHLLENWAREVWRVNSSSLVRIANGVDTDRFRPASGRGAFRQHLGISQGTSLVGSLGRLAEVKNQRLLLEAFSQLDGDHPVELALAGAGEEARRLRAYASELGVGRRFHLIEHLAEPEQLLREVAVFVLTSKSEQHPLVVLEAMAFGLPIVATDVGDIRAMLPEIQRASIVPNGPQAAPQLAARIRELLEQPDLRAEFGQANRERVLDLFSIEGMLAAHLGLRQELLRQALQRS